MFENSYAAKTAQTAIAKNRAFAATPEGKEKIAKTQNEVGKIRAEQQVQSQSQTNTQTMTQTNAQKQ
jgi:hypothetical protein